MKSHSVEVYEEIRKLLTWIVFSLNSFQSQLLLLGFLQHGMKIILSFEVRFVMKVASDLEDL